MIKNFIQKTFGGNTNEIANTLMFGNRMSAPRRGAKELLAAYSTAPWVRGAVSKVAQSIATVEWRAFSVKGKNDLKFRRHYRAQRAYGKSRKEILKTLSGKNELVEIETHPILDVLSGGNALINGLNTSKLSQIYLDLIGESFLLKERNLIGVPTALWPLNPLWVKEIPESLEGTFTVQLTNNTHVKIPASDMIWINDPDPLKPYARGIGIGMSLGDEIDADEFTAKYIKDFFLNSARPDLIVSSKELDPSETKRLENDFNNRNRGIFKRFKAHFIGREIKVDQITQDVRSMKIADLRKLSRDIILQVYGIPPEIMGVVESSNRATIENADYIFARYVLMPRLELLRSVYQQMLVSEFDDRIILDYTSPIEQDKEHKLDVVKAASWAFTVDEVRNMAEEPEKDMGQGTVHAVPFNLTFTDDLSSTGPRTPPPTNEVVEIDDEEEKSGRFSKNNLFISNTKDFLNTSEVGALVNAVDAQHLNDAVKNSSPSMIEAFGQGQLDAVNAGFKFNLQSEAVQEFINRDSFNRIRSKVNATTKENLRLQLIESVSKNETIVQLTGRISDVFDIAVGRRARTIARTESVRISNFGASEGMKQGFVEGKQWLSSRDAVVRDSHQPGLGLDGIKVALNSNFKSPITGAEGPFPGDLGLASEDINCRCSILAVLNMDGKEFTEEQKTAMWKTFEAQRIPFERILMRDIRIAFKTQRADVLNKLDSIIGAQNA